MQEINYLMPEIIQGIKAGGLAAIEQARRTHTNLVVMRKGEVVEITPDEADAIIKEQEIHKG